MLTFTCATFMLASVAGAQGAPTSRPRVTRASELPAFSYPLRGNVEALVRDASAPASQSLRAAVRRDIDSVLRTYDIADAGLTRSLKGTLVSIAVLDGRDDDALALIEERRALAAKVGTRLMTGIEMKAIIAARRANPDIASDAFARDVGRRLTAALRALPFDSVQNELREAKAGLALFNEAMLISPARGEVQKTVDRDGGLPLSTARDFISVSVSLRYDLPLKPVLFAAYDSALAGRTIAAKKDIWPARSVTLTDADRPSQVTIGIWDSGVDTTLFPRHLARDAGGRLVVRGFNQFIRPENTPMASMPPELLARRDDMTRLYKALGDLDSNLETPETKFLNATMASLTPDSVAIFEEWMDQWNEYSHGTAVTSVAVEGNPAVRVVVGRMQFSHAKIPTPCPSRANAEREAAMLAQMVAFFRAQGARVVNMSWGRPEGGFVSELERCAPSLSAAERASIARYAVDTLRRTMMAGLRASPRILFVASAGNAGNNTEFNDFALRIDLPNMMLVGAVDRAGDEASWTNTGPLVRLYANGYLVETRVPGGSREASSGTSFAAPGVVNTAAKMLAVRPTLSTSAIAEILLRTADVMGPRGLRVMNPAKAVAEARSFAPR